MSRTKSDWDSYRDTVVKWRNQLCAIIDDPAFLPHDVGYREQVELDGLLDQCVTKCNALIGEYHKDWDL